MRTAEIWGWLRRRATIRNKILALDILLFGVCFTLIVIASSNSTAKIMQRQIENAIAEEQRLIRVNLDSLLGRAEYLSDLIFGDSSICTFIRTAAQKGDQEQIQDYFTLKPRLTDMINASGNLCISMYLPDEYYYVQDRINFLPESEIASQGYYEEVLDQNGQILWLYMPQDNSVSALRVYKDVGFDYGKLGILEINIGCQGIRDILQRTQSDYSQITYILDTNGTVIASSDGSEMSPFSDMLLAEIGADGMAQPVRSNIGAEDCMIISERVDRSGWILATMVPYRTMMRQIVSLRNRNVLFLLAILAVSIFGSLIALNRITGRIKTLSSRMLNVEQHHFEQLLEVRHADEFSVIEDQYNKMCVRLKTLIREVYEVEIKKREAELCTLQAQINPHFLYNALDTINWMAVDRGAYEISTMVTNLGKFTRMSLSRGRTILPLRDELEITRLYLAVQKARFGDFLEVSFDVDKDILDCVCLKLLLQPIVENAIKHGFQKEQMRKGRIEVRGFLTGDRIHMEIRDNGVGIDGNYDLGREEERGIASGYGLQNVQERLSLYYRDDYALRIGGEIGEGTTVTLEWTCLHWNES